MFGQMRSNRSTALVIGVVIFLAAFVGLAYDHLDNWEPPVDTSDSESISIPEVHGPFSRPNHPSNASTELGAVYFEHIMKPSIRPDTPTYAPFGVFPFELPANPRWTESLGEQFCVIDMDNRPFDEAGQVFNADLMSWDRPSEVHGLSTGVLNHWVYAKIHGYKYYYIDLDTYEDRRNSWKKPPILSKILKNHEACVFLDSDAIFNRLDLPFEWLMNYWSLSPETNSFALAADPNAKSNQDKFGKVYLNTGFIILQNNDKTFEIMDAWQDCAEEGGKHPECVDFRKNRPGKPTDQGGFGTYIRYDYPKDIKELPCTEANGFPESHSGCDGKFIKHLWTGKKDHIKVAVGNQLPGALLENFHRQFLEEKKDFFMTERQLMSS